MRSPLDALTVPETVVASVNLREVLSDFIDSAEAMDVMRFVVEARRRMSCNGLDAMLVAYGERVARDMRAGSSAVADTEALVAFFRSVFAEGGEVDTWGPRLVERREYEQDPTGTKS